MGRQLDRLMLFWQPANILHSVLIFMLLWQINIVVVAERRALDRYLAPQSLRTQSSASRCPAHSYRSTVNKRVLRLCLKPARKLSNVSTAAGIDYSRRSSHAKMRFRTVDLYDKHNITIKWSHSKPNSKALREFKPPPNRF